MVAVLRNCAYGHVIPVHGRQCFLVIGKPPFRAEGVHVGSEDGGVAVRDPGVDADYALHLPKTACRRQFNGTPFARL